MIKKINITDKWFLDNGYFTIGLEDRTPYTYEIWVDTQKWKALSETCFRIIDLSTEIVTPEILIKTIKAGTRRDSPYIKLSPEIKRMRILRKRELKNDNRKSK